MSSCRERWREAVGVRACQSGGGQTTARSLRPWGRGWPLLLSWAIAGSVLGAAISAGTASAQSQPGPTSQLNRQAQSQAQSQLQSQPRPQPESTASARQPAATGPNFPGIGRTATPREVAAWDTEVRADLKGLPRGVGTVSKGQDIWEAQCASCHGVFGESNEIFTPIVGGTTADDIRSGHVARLTDTGYPQRTTLMKLSTVSSLWDYIHRAMPWNAPRTLSVNDTYAVTAYILNLGNIVPDDFELSDRTMASVQQRLTNRNGMTTDHAMWPGATLGGRGRSPDVRPTACMSNCAPEPRVASLIPDHARGAHGNLAKQNRAVGAQVGADTSRPMGSPRVAAAAETPAATTATAVVSDFALAQRSQCLTCHGIENRVVGPSFREVIAKHASRPDVLDYYRARIRQGGVGIWGAIAMPAQPDLSDAEATALARWLVQGAPR